MYFGDHPPPHVHVDYQGFEALVAIDDGRVLRGALPIRAHRLVVEWIDLHRLELVANFERVARFVTPERIRGLDHAD